MNLLQSAADWAIGRLPVAGNDVLKAHLSGLAPEATLHLYHLWAARMAPPVPRKVVVSSRVEGVRDRHDEALVQLIDELERGQLLSPRIVNDLAIVAGLRGDGAQSNLMRLAENEGVHALWLDQGAPDPVLLFAVLDMEQAFLADVQPVSRMDEAALIAVLDEELPKPDLNATLDSLAAKVPGMTAENLASIKASGLLDAALGKAANELPRQKPDPDRFNKQATAQTERLLAQLSGFEAEWRENGDSLRMELAEQGISLPENPKFHFSTFNGQPGIVETSLDIFLPLE